MDVLDGAGVEQCRHVVNLLPEDSIILQFSRFIACPNILHVCKSSIEHLYTGLKSQPQVYAYFLVQHNTLCNQFQCHYCVRSPL
jgi:hypothetical protein